MKNYKIILPLVCIILLMNKCRKNIEISTNEIEVENKVPENFFAKSQVPGTLDDDNKNNSHAELQQSVNQNTIDPNNGEDPVILGTQLTNPYTLANMQNAVNIMTGGNGPTLVANNLYVRFKPTNSLQFEELEENQDLELQDYPMDYSLIQDGDYYQDPNLGIEEIGWLYAVVPTSYVAPIGIQYEVITPIFNTDNLFLEQLAESLASGAAYSYLRNKNGELTITRTDLQPNVTYLRPPVPCNEDDICCIDPGAAGCGGGGTILPPPALTNSGIYVQEQSICDQQNLPVLPLRQVRLVARRWFKINKVYTNDIGQYTFTRSFNNNTRVLVKTKNTHASVRKVRGARIWQMLFPAKKNIGTFTSVQLRSIRYVFEKPLIESKELVYWAAATTHNSVLEFKEYTTEFGLTQPPNKLHIMVTNWNQSVGAGAAPMFNKCTNGLVPTSAYISHFIAAPVYITAAIVFGNAIKNEVDLVVGYRSNINYNCYTNASLKSIVYHELGHAQHFGQAGCDYWKVARNAQITEISKLDQQDFSPYGTGNDPTTAPILAVNEMWGNHAEKYYSERHYGNGGIFSNNFWSLGQRAFFFNNDVPGLNANYSAIESFDPNLQADVHRWIPQGLPYDLMDNRNDNLTTVLNDNVGGFTINQSFDALQSDVRSIPAFRNRLLLNSGNNQQAQVNQLFQQYGY